MVIDTLAASWISYAVTFIITVDKQLQYTSASDWCAPQEALYKCIDTIQYSHR